MNIEAIISAIEQGNRSALAKGISVAEQGGKDAQQLLASLGTWDRKSRRIGITGPPGAGKSTLCAAMATSLADEGKRVAILAIDPSSPFTHGAILGDRIRMLDLNDDIYVRSLATRGYRGGLGNHTADVVDVLEAAGFDDVIIETVGVGQSEFEVRGLVDTLMVVLVPESGDRIQAIKAGLMEVADIYVLNKFDRPGGDIALRNVQSSLSYQHHFDPDWSPALVSTVATDKLGIDTLIEAITRHEKYLNSSGEGLKRKRERIKIRIRSGIEEAMMRKMNDLNEGEINNAIDQIIGREISTLAVVEQLVKNTEK